MSEQATQHVLNSQGLCGGCQDGCLPPVSLVTFARIFVGDRSMSYDCDELVQAWEEVASLGKQFLIAAAADLRNELHNQGGAVDISDPKGIASLLVDSEFGQEGNDIVRSTSSIFATVPSGRPFWDVFGLMGKLDRAETSETVSGVYAFNGESVHSKLSSQFLSSDLKLVVGSFLATALAVLLHTRSLWLTIVALIQISLSFPLANFCYSVVAGIRYFPFINYVGLFVVFAVGADDVFVALDKWKNARLDYHSMTTESIACIALPSAACSMLLTTVSSTTNAVPDPYLFLVCFQITSAIAFFATAICPVPALRLFGVFSGMLILSNYLLCILLIFPAICIYDRRNQKRRDGLAQMNSQPGFVRSALTGYSTIVRKGRILCLLFVALAGAAAVFFAMKLSPPSSSELRLLRPSHEFEIAHRWQADLLVSALTREKGSRVWLLWGVSPADTGDPSNPEDQSRLVLDDSFDPAPETNQLYLLKFCDDLHNRSFAQPDTVDSVCPMQFFEKWVKKEALENNNTTKFFCGNATGLPIPEDSFHLCFTEFARIKKYSRALIRDGKVVIIQVPFRQAEVTWLSSHSVLTAAWVALDEFTTSRNDMAPEGVNRVFGTSTAYWWYDSNERILAASVGTIAITLSAAFLVVLLFSRSLVITLIAVVSIGFILVSSAGVLASNGWNIGFVESLCFAILLGISCDFVLHFSHSYCSLAGIVSSHERTKYALVDMGPSILAAAMTTITASVILLFTTLDFFYKFGTVLLWSLIMGVFGSLFVFVVLVDTFGPSKPHGRYFLREHTIPSVVVPTQEATLPALLFQRMMGMIPCWRTWRTQTSF